MDGPHQAKHWHCGLHIGSLSTRGAWDKPLTYSNEPSTKSGKPERSGVLHSSVLVQSFAVINRAKPSLRLPPELQAPAMRLVLNG